MDKIVIVLPFLPPSLNRVAGRGPYNYRQAKERFTEQVRLNCLNGRPKAPVDRSTVTIRYYFPDRRRRDPDNYSGKFLLDGLTKAGGGKCLHRPAGPQDWRLPALPVALGRRGLCAAAVPEP